MKHENISKNNEAITNFVPAYEAAKNLGVSKQTIYRWIREGKMPEGEYKVIEKMVKRILINRDYRPC